MEDELHSSQQQYRQCLDELEQFERKIHELEREIAQGKELNAKYSRDVSWCFQFDVKNSLSLSVFNNSKSTLVYIALEL